MHHPPTKGSHTMQPAAMQPAAMEPAAMEPAAVAETHISVLFSFGDRVVKVRKPVRFGFLDFTRLEARAEDCRREVELNRRLAPDVYLGTAEVRMGGDVVEHAVVMRRLPAARNLGRLAATGADLHAEIPLIAGALAAFHAGARRSEEISDAATAAALGQRWRIDAGEVARFVGPVLDPGLHRHTVELAERYLAGRGELFEHRIATGQVCDGHGDLQAGDIFCLDDGPRILDCLEFDDRLRYGDVLADVAFLAMDLERLGRPEAARQLLDRYRRESGSAFPDSLAHFYVAARAHVRMLVACLRAEQDGRTDGGAAHALLELAHRHLLEGRVRLVLVGGLPGVGKSTVAEAVGRAIGADVLSTDRTRRSLSAGPEGGGGSRGGGGGEARYSEAARAAVYAALLDEAATRLHGGRSVVIDATWASGARRHQARTTALRTWADVTEIRLDCPADVARERIAARLAVGGGDSEATVEVAEQMAERFDPWPSARVLDTAGPAQEVRALAVALVTGPEEATG